MNFFNTLFSIFVEMSPYLLLGIFFVALLNLFVSKDFIAKHIGENNYLSIAKSAIFGVPLPLCSCGVIPTSVYLAKSGASKPAVISFLISTPQTGIDSIVATYGMLGPIFAVFRPIAAFLMGIFGGVIAMWNSNDNSNKQQEDTFPLNFQFQEYGSTKSNFFNRLKSSIKYAFKDFIDDISVQFLWGLLIAGAITIFVPDDFYTRYFEKNELLAMLAVILLGIPMYVCATASIPVAVSLMMKGFSPGVAYVFLVSGPVSNAASISILSKTLGKKTMIIYISTIIVSAIVFGFLLNGIFYLSGIEPHTQILHIHTNHRDFTILQYLLSFAFFILLLMSFYRKYVNRFIKKERISMNEKKFKIDGMTCNHCVMNVSKALKTVPGVEDVKVDLSEGSAIVKGEYNPDLIRQAIEEIGYTFKGEI